MPETTQKLILELQAKVDKYNRDILNAAKSTKKFQKDTVGALTRVERQTKRTGDSLFKFSNVAKGVFAALSANAFITFADDITLADNQLRNVTTSTEQFNFVLMELTRIANETRQSTNGLVSVFSKFSRAGQEAGFSTRELLDFTEKLTKAFKLEGNSVAEVNSILLQLVQSFRKGNIDGEEFRALSEGSTLALQALSKQMRVNIGDLKALGAAGKIAPRDLIEGLKGVGQQIDDEFLTLEPTFAELGTRLGNAFATSFRDSAFDKTADNFKRVAFEAVDAIERFFTGVESKTAPQLKQLITDQIKEVDRLNALQEKGILDYGRAIRIAVDDLEELNQRAKDLAETQSKLTADEGGGGVTPRKPAVKFDAGDDRTIDRAKRRLQILEESAEQEVQLAQAVEDKKITIEEANAQAENQREVDRLNESFTRTLEALNIKNETIAEVEALAKEIGFEKLNEDEQNILDLKQRFADAEVALTEKQLKKIQKLQEIAAKNKQQLTLSAGSRLLGAIANLADKGSAIEKIAAKGSIIASTAAGIMRQFKDLPQPLAGISAGAIALEGVAALSAVGGGGSIPSGGGGGGGDTGGLSTEQQDFAEETTGLEVTESTIEGTQTGQIFVSLDDPILDVILQGINEAQRKGRT